MRNVATVPVIRQLMALAAPQQCHFKPLYVFLGKRSPLNVPVAALLLPAAKIADCDLCEMP